MIHASVYLDVNVISALHYPGGSVLGRGRKTATQQWWDLEKNQFETWVSEFGEKELRNGVYPGQSKAIAAIRRLRYLQFNDEIQTVTEYFLEQSIIPKSASGDAIHLAFATCYKIDYLLSWNYAHLNNVEVQRKLTEACERKGWRRPILVSPETIPKMSLGQSVRRKP